MLSSWRSEGPAFFSSSTKMGAPSCRAVCDRVGRQGRKWAVERSPSISINQSRLAPHFKVFERRFPILGNSRWIDTLPQRLQHIPIRKQRIDALQLEILWKQPVQNSCNLNPQLGRIQNIPVDEQHTNSMAKFTCIGIRFLRRKIDRHKT